MGALGVSINSNSLSEPLTLWGLEDMINALPNSAVVGYKENLNCEEKILTQEVGLRGRKFTVAGCFTQHFCKAVTTGAMQGTVPFELEDSRSLSEKGQIILQFTDVEDCKLTLMDSFEN